MPRPPRADEAGAIYHALNRGNAKQTLFRKEDDYHAFERILVDALRDFPVDLLAYQWMPNHWHMVLRPRENGAMSRMLQWAAMTHAARHHAHYQTVGNGHIYQGRFKSPGPDRRSLLCGLPVRGAKRVSGGAGFKSRRLEMGQLVELEQR